MRSQAVKRIQNQPMKSPSPDLVNKNCIKNTTVQITDVYRYIDRKQGKQSKSPKLSNTLAHNKSHHAEQAQNLRQRIRELEHQNQQLQAEKKSYSNIAQTNSRLNGELSKMREILKHKEKTDISPRNNDDSTLKQYRDRILQLAEENRRISKKLQEKQANCQLIQRQNMEQRRQIEDLKFMGAKDENKNIEAIRLYYSDKVQPQIRQNQLIWLNRLRQIEDRIDLIRKYQSLAEQKLSQLHQQKQSTFITPAKDSRRTYYPNQPSQTSDRPSNSFESPFSQRQKQQEMLKRQNQYLTEQMNILKNEIEFQRQKNRNLEQNKWKISVSEPSAVNDSFLKKIEYLESELESKVKKIASLEKSLLNERQESGIMKERLERTNYLFQNQMTNYKKAVQQERQKCLTYEADLANLVQKYKKLQENSVDVQESNKYKQRLQIYYENELSKTKKYYVELLNEKQQSIDKELNNYLQMLRSIRKGIIDTNIDEMIGEHEMMTVQKNDIQKRFNLMRDQSQKIINEIKRRMILQEQKIIQLQKNNQLLMNEIMQLNVEKEKLKKAMIQFQELKLPTHQTSKTVEISQQSSRYKCEVKGCLKETLQKIDTLEEKITKILKQ